MTNAILGALTVLVTTNFAGVTFAPIPCLHPSCVEGHHSFAATERYMIIRDTWAQLLNGDGTDSGFNKRIYSDTNAWGSLSHPIAHPAAYHLHTQPGWPVRPGTRWPLDLPPLPPWEAYERAGALRVRQAVHRLPQGLVTNLIVDRIIGRNVTVIPPDPRTSQIQTQTDATNWAKLDTNNLERIRQGAKFSRADTNWVLPTAGSSMLFFGPHWTNLPPAQRFRAVPATNEMSNSRKFKP